MCRDYRSPERILCRLHSPEELKTLQIGQWVLLVIVQLLDSSCRVPNVSQLRHRMTAVSQRASLTYTF